MRKIKFRGQTVDTKELIYGDLIQTEKDFKNVVEILDWSKVGCKPEKSLVVNHETVGQFTGLTDKNGVEIYEGDIVTDKLSKCQIIYGEYTHKADLDSDIYIVGFLRKWSDGSISPLGYYNGLDSFVIGNIHDNPELL